MSEAIQEDAAPEASRCGFVAVIGATNVGKSTLVNALVGTKVSIVTPKVQTTRALIRGIAIQGNAQLILVDTPGIFAPRRRLDRAMVDGAWAGTRDADLVAVVIDASKGVEDDDEAIVKALAEVRVAKTLVLNKIDLVAKPKLLDLAHALNDQAAFAASFMISARSADGVAELKSFLAAHLPAGPWLYPADQISDAPMRQFAAEITREKLMTLAWFVWLYERFEALHALASRFVAPYKERARELAREGWRALLSRFQPRARSDDSASAAKAATSTSSARTVGSSPASPSH